MKPKQIAAEKERRARAKFRVMARRIPDNAVLTNILLQMEKPIRAALLRNLTPHLRFRPISLEDLHG